MPFNSALFRFVYGLPDPERKPAAEMTVEELLNHIPVCCFGRKTVPIRDSQIRSPNEGSKRPIDE